MAKNKSASAAIGPQLTIAEIGLPIRCRRYPPDGMAMIVSEMARPVTEAAVEGETPRASINKGA